MDGKKGANKLLQNLKNLTQNLKHFCRTPDRAERGRTTLIGGETERSEVFFCFYRVF